VPEESKKTYTIRLSDAAAQRVQKEAEELGITPTAFIQALVAGHCDGRGGGDVSGDPRADEALSLSGLPAALERYLNHIIFELVRTRVSLFYIAENRIAPEEELKEIYDTAAESGRDYLEELEKHMAKAAAAADENAPESSAGPAAKER
jgi:hypothetical protein